MYIKHKHIDSFILLFKDEYNTWADGLCQHTAQLQESLLIQSFQNTTRIVPPGGGQAWQPWIYKMAWKLMD